MKNHKRIWICLLALCMILGTALSGCNDQATGSTPPVDPTQPVGPSPDFTTGIVWADMFGDQEGALTIMPDTKEWSLSYENPYGSHKISGTYAEDGSMTCTDDAGEGQYLPLDAIYAAGEEVIKAFLNGKTDFPPVSTGNQDGADISAGIVWADMFGDQEGTLIIMPDTMEWSLSYENPYGSHKISGTYAEDGSMTCTDDAGEGQYLPLDAIYAAGEEVIKAFLNARQTFPPVSTGNQGEGGSISADFDAFTEIKTSGVLNHELTFTKLPDAYNTFDTQHKGSNIFIEYTTDVYGDGVTYNKFARVYLPYGYDPDDKDTKYNVLYLQHGNNCTPSSLFDLKLPTADFKTLLDNMFDPEHGVMDPFIIVCPTYYFDIEKDAISAADDAPAGDGRFEEIPAMYHREVVEDLIPAVESQLNVYCSDFSEEGIKATRDHRAWGGFSRGSMCTWYLFHHDLEYFTYWMPTSANCLEEGVALGSEHTGQWTDEKAFAYVSEPIKAHPELDFFIIAQSGDETDATAMRTQMKYFIDQTDVFSYGLDREENNIYYTCSDFKHMEHYFPYYIYTAKDILFK